MEELTFQKIDKGNFTNEAGLRVSPDQLRFVCADLEEYVRGWQSDQSFDCFHIYYEGKPVGFFALDLSPERHPHISTKEDFCVLRCFLIDARFQGLGIASKSLQKLDSHIKDFYPNLSEVFLTVNFVNPRAIKTYLNAGFAKVEAPFLGGKAGPQHILVKRLSTRGRRSIRQI